MSFTINFNYNGLDEAREISDLVEEKLESIEKYLHENDVTTCDVLFKKVAPHQNGNVHYIEANLQVGGQLYRAEATEESFEKAIDEVKDELTKELGRDKEKRQTLEKQEGREVKEKMLGIK